MTTPQPPHPVPALTATELSGYRRQLEQAITGITPGASARAGLNRRLQEVLAKQRTPAPPSPPAPDARRPDHRR